MQPEKRAVLLSIRPEWVYEIANGYKTVEVRKSCPNLEVPFKVYIYCTSKYPLVAFAECFNYGLERFEMEVSLIEGYGRKAAEETFELFNGHVIGEFTCGRVDTIVLSQSTEGMEPPRLCIRDEQCRHKPIDGLLHESGLSLKELESYLQGRTGYGLHISNLEVYDTPVELSRLSPACLFKGWQGICKVHGKASCEHQDERFTSAGGLCAIACKKRVERAPQSWCYVEEGLKDE